MTSDVISTTVLATTSVDRRHEFGTTWSSYYALTDSRRHIPSVGQGVPFHGLAGDDRSIAPDSRGTLENLPRDYLTEPGINCAPPAYSPTTVRRPRFTRTFPTPVTVRDPSPSCGNTEYPKLNNNPRRAS